MLTLISKALSSHRPENTYHRNFGNMLNHGRFQLKYELLIQ